MARVLTWKDVINFGKAFLLLALPMTWVVAQQFQADAEDIMNVAAGGTGHQVETSGGKGAGIRDFYFCEWNCFLLLLYRSFHYLRILDQGTFPKWMLSWVPVLPCLPW